MVPEELFLLTEEEQEVKRFIEEFAEERLLPLVTTQEALLAHEFTPAIFYAAFNAMREAGLTQFGIPEAYGGLPLSSRSMALMTEGLCAVDGGIGLSLGATLSLVAAPLIAYGTEEQKRLWLPLLASGEAIGCYCQTEPGAGSDVSAVNTKAVTGDDGLWRITGTKIFITNGSEAHVALVLARTNTDPHRGLTMFIVDCAKAKAEGKLLVLKNEHKAGLHHSPTTQMHFDGVVAHSILGELNGGWGVALGTLGGSRATVIPAQSVGIMRGVLAIVRHYVEERMQFGVPIGTFRAVRYDILRMETLCRMAQLLNWRSAIAKDKAAAIAPGDSRPYDLEASVAKLFATEAAERVASDGIQLLGGMGYMLEMRVARFWHDSRIGKIYEGTSEIQERIIVRELLSRAKAAGKAALARASLTGTPWVFGRNDDQRIAVGRWNSRLRALRHRFAHAFTEAWRYFRPTHPQNLPAPWHALADAYAALEGATLVAWHDAWKRGRRDVGERDAAIVVQAFLEADRALKNAEDIIEAAKTFPPYATIVAR